MSSNACPPRIPIGKFVAVALCLYWCWLIRAWLDSERLVLTLQLGSGQVTRPAAAWPLLPFLASAGDLPAELLMSILRILYGTSENAAWLHK